MARGIQDQELEARSLSSLGWIHIRAGDFQEAMLCLETSLALYAALGDEPTASRELPLPAFIIGAPLTQSLTYRASEAACWGLLAFAHVNGGQVHTSLRSGRRALALSQESRNVYAHILSTLSLTQGLLDAGEYEEALVLTQHAVALVRTLPLTVNFPRLLTVLGSVYQALQQCEEAHRTLAEAVAVAERLDLGPLRVPVFSQLCMHYAVQAIALRKRHDVALIPWDFSPQYETEALLRVGNERQAREAVHRLGERLGPYRRFRIPYLRSEAALAAWDGQREQAIGHLREAVQLAADLGLPAERWQIQAALGSLYQTEGEQEQARTAFGEAARIIQGLAQGIGDEARRSRFLAGPQIHQVLQYAQGLANPVPNDHTEPSGL